MKTLLIVDDEIHAIEGLKASLDWPSLGIRVLSATSAAEAQAIQQHEIIDFMLCDIEMPQGNGLELAAWARENHPSTEIIFLTCHAEFAYARQAIQLGSLDYLLKPVTGPDLLRVVQKTLGQLEQRNQKQQLTDFGTFWIRNQSLLIERFWLDIFNQTIAEHAGALWNEVSARNIPYIPTMNFLPLLVYIHQWPNYLDQKELRNREFAVRRILDELFSGAIRGFSLNLVRIDPKTSLAILIGQADSPVSTAELHTVCAELLARCHQELKITVACYFGTLSELSAMSSQYSRLISAAQDNVMAQSTIVDIANLSNPVIRVRQADMKTWSILLSAGVQDVVISDAETFLKRLGQSGQLDLAVLQCFQQDFLQMLYLILGSRQVQAHELLIDAIDIKAHNLPELVHWLQTLCKRTIELIHLGDDAAQTPVDRARSFIATHVNRPLSCEEIANWVHVHPDHLSRMFKKETGLSISNYLIKQRMQLAAELIATSRLSISRIAGEVGYDNFSHFTRMFRQYSGMTPMEYRRTQPKADQK